MNPCIYLFIYLPFSVIIKNKLTDNEKTEKTAKAYQLQELYI